MRDRQPNPYVGPRAFSAWDAPKFFGREREVAALRVLLIERRIDLLSAARGAGKSSLVNAGLIPHLGKNGLQVLRPFARGNAAKRVGRDRATYTRTSSFRDLHTRKRLLCR